MSITKQQWFLLCALSLGTFTSTVVASLQASFYPQEAEKRGASATENGLVLGIYELFGFISCPIYGKYMGRLGSECLLKAGIMLAGVSTILFGLVDLADDYYWFMSLSYLLRVTESLGSAAIITATLSLTPVVFADSFARALSAIQVFQGLAYMLAPSIGGYLFEIGGFWCPFVVVGVSVLFSGVLLCFALFNFGNRDSKNKPLAPIWPVFKIIPVLLDTCCLAVGGISIGFILATLEPHLRKFHLSPTTLGAMFIITSIIYTLVSPIIGILCDKHFNTKNMIIVGGLANIFGFLLIGPMPYIPLDTSLWMVGVGMGLVGMSMSLIHVPAMVDALAEAVKHGLPPDITTYALIAGISEAMTSLGAFIGPSVAGILFDAIGFRRSSLFIVLVNAILIVAIVWSARVKHTSNNQIQGSTHLNATPLNTYLEGALAAKELDIKGPKLAMDDTEDNIHTYLLK